MVLMVRESGFRTTNILAVPIQLIEENHTTIGVLQCINKHSGPFGAADLYACVCVCFSSDDDFFSAKNGHNWRIRHALSRGHFRTECKEI